MTAKNPSISRDGGSRFYFPVVVSEESSVENRTGAHRLEFPGAETEEMVIKNRDGRYRLELKGLLTEENLSREVELESKMREISRLRE